MVGVPPLLRCTPCGWSSHAIVFGKVVFPTVFRLCDLAAGVANRRSFFILFSVGSGQYCPVLFLTIVVVHRDVYVHCTLSSGDCWCWLFER